MNSGESGELPRGVHHRRRKIAGRGDQNPLAKRVATVSVFLTVGVSCGRVLRACLVPDANLVDSAPKGRNNEAQANEAVKKSTDPVILSVDYMTLRLTTGHENDSVTLSFGGPFFGPKNLQLFCPDS